MALLELRGVYKTFNPGTPDEVRALRGVDLTVEPGSFVVVIGTNGSGKSTTLNSVAGSFRIDAGTIRLAGREITGWPEHRRAKLIGRVFQDPLAGTSPSLSIAENLALACRRGLPRGLGRAVSRRKVAEFRDRVRPLGMGLEDRLDNAIGSLSGGQRQALTLLMATYRRPELLLLDEHTAALDPRSAEQVIRLTEQVVRRQHLTHLDGHPFDGPRRLAGRQADHGPPGPPGLRRLGRRKTTPPSPRPAREVRGAAPLRPAR